ncbi:MAG: mechanosensitive ion channel family protein, partial [Candidatus Nanohaloarchaea archaeon]|nr:mechanosensitive ion channel family protein [Candidatus Nanohaloarchaea archaeon]
MAFTGLFIVFKIVLERMAMHTIRESKTRYVFRKANSVIYLAVFGLVLARIWVPDPQALLVAYGIVGAGVAVSLQDVFKNFAGGLTLFISNLYRVGDRIEIDEMRGDVIDIGLFYTKVLEIENWVQGDQATGRIIHVPNGKLLGGTTVNYTLDNTFLWEDMTIPITYESDWEQAKTIAREIIEDESGEMTENASKELSDIRKKYFIGEKEIQPQLFIELTDNWINLHLRYITDVRERRSTNNRISNRLLQRIEDSDDVEIASETVAITRFPGQDEDLPASD